MKIYKSGDLGFYMAPLTCEDIILANLKVLTGSDEGSLKYESIPSSWFLYNINGILVPKTWIKFLYDKSGRITRCGQFWNLINGGILEVRQVGDRCLLIDNHKLYGASDQVREIIAETIKDYNMQERGLPSLN